MAFGKNVDLANLSVLSVDLDFDSSSLLIEDNMENDDLFESKTLSFEPVNKDDDEVAKKMADLNMDASNDKENENEVTILKKREKKRVSETKVARKLSAFTATTKPNTTFTVTTTTTNNNNNAGRENNSVDGVCIRNDTTTSMSENKGIYDRGGDEDEDEDGEEVEETVEEEDTNLLELKMDDVAAAAAAAAAAIEQRQQQVLMKLLRTIVYDNMLGDQEKIILIVKFIRDEQQLLMKLLRTIVNDNILGDQEKIILIAKLIRDDDDGIIESDNNDISNTNTERSRSGIARINNISNPNGGRWNVVWNKNDGISESDNNDTSNKKTERSRSVVVRINNNSNEVQVQSLQKVVGPPCGDVNNAPTTNTVIASKTTSSNGDIKFKEPTDDGNCQFCFSSKSHIRLEDHFIRVLSTTSKNSRANRLLDSMYTHKCTAGNWKDSTPAFGVKSEYSESGCHALYIAKSLEAVLKPDDDDDDVDAKVISISKIVDYMDDKKTISQLLDRLETQVGKEYSKAWTSKNKNIRNIKADGNAYDDFFQNVLDKGMNVTQKANVMVHRFLPPPLDTEDRTTLEEVWGNINEESKFGEGFGNMYGSVSLERKHTKTRVYCDVLMFMLPFTKVVTLKRVADIKEFVNGDTFPVLPPNGDGDGYTKYKLANDFIKALCHKETSKIETMFGEYSFPTEAEIIYPYLNKSAIPDRMDKFST